MVNMYKCIKCQANEVLDEFERCEPCEEIHKKFVQELDKRPKLSPVPKKEPRWIPASVPGGKLYLE